MILGWDFTASLNARSISFPVASLACKILLAEWPPSLANLNSPRSSVSKLTPIETKSLIQSAALSITVLTIL